MDDNDEYHKFILPQDMSAYLLCDVFYLLKLNGRRANISLSGGVVQNSQCLERSGAGNDLLYMIGRIFDESSDEND